MTDIRRKVSMGAVKLLGLGDRQLRVTASDGTPDRANDIVVASGCKLDNFRKNPIVLAQHDITKPIARCLSIGIEGDAVVALVQFPEIGVSALADEYCALAKAGVIGAASIGFLPIRYEPRKQGGLKFIEWELLELSLVSVPANPNAVVTAKRLDTRGLRIAEARRVRSEVALLSAGYTSSEAKLLIETRRAPIGTCARNAFEACGLRHQAECIIHRVTGL